jgi:hypothetical protein
MKRLAFPQVLSLIMRQINEKGVKFIINKLYEKHVLTFIQIVLIYSLKKFLNNK